MGDIIYLKMRGERQGDISAGCGTEASIGNRFQLGHENEIFAFSLSNCITGTGKEINLQGLRFSKLIDKSSPLLTTGITNNETFSLEFNFYRTSRYGAWEKYYCIELRGALLAAIRMHVSNNNLDTELIEVRYEYILCKHLTANTEFSYLAFPANYNSLFSPRDPGVQTEKPLQTLNSKAVGRLLAAGGLYNGNVEGFRKTTEQLGGDAPAGYKQVMDNKGLIIAGASVVAGLTMGRLGAMSEISEISSYSKIPSFKSPSISGFTSESGALLNAEHAVIDPKKLATYALNPDHPYGGNKARVFESALGYNPTNADVLAARVKDGILSTPANALEVKDFGQPMAVDMPILGVNGETVLVRTGWIYETDAVVPRLTTLFVKK